MVKVRYSSTRGTTERSRGRGLREVAAPSRGGTATLPGCDADGSDTSGISSSLTTLEGGTPGGRVAAALMANAPTSCGAARDETSSLAASSPYSRPKLWSTVSPGSSRKPAPCMFMLSNQFPLPCPETRKPEPSSSASVASDRRPSPLSLTTEARCKRINAETLGRAQVRSISVFSLRKARSSFTIIRTHAVLEDTARTAEFRPKAGRGRGLCFDGFIFALPAASRKAL